MCMYMYIYIYMYIHIYIYIYREREGEIIAGLLGPSRRLRRLQVREVHEQGDAFKKNTHKETNKEEDKLYSLID